MLQNWKTVRVFISSTFQDMQAERDWLVRFVFPRLRDELQQQRIHLVDVDLRWGVTSEQDALDVCLEVIDECRPRFLCILGGRYGWVPPGKTRSITADEIHYGVLDRDLSKRGSSTFYFRDETATAAMVEDTPGEFREPQGSDKQTKLDELKQAIVDAGLHPFIYPAQWDKENARLTSLKVFGDRVFDDLLNGMKSDPELRERFMLDMPAKLDKFSEEKAAMDAFVAERNEGFVLGSRASVLTQLLAHTVTTGGNGYVCLIGKPGSGKSALLAHLSQHSTLNNQPTTILIRHFVGTSPDSTDVRHTMRRFCHELKAGCPEIAARIPYDPEELRAAFLEFLRQASASHRVVILLDAINQFDIASDATRFQWLPDQPPNNARFILSALEGPALEYLRRRPGKLVEIELKPLTTDDGEAIIEHFRQRYHKKLEPEQRAALLTKADAGTPLYLLAALEELRTLGTYEEITRRIVELPPITSELFAWILERLENDDGFRDAAMRQIGRELVSRFAALLGASRYGLSQRELTDLLDPHDPQGNVAALLQLLRPYLMRRGELLDFYHRQFRTAAEKAWLKTDTQHQSAHTQLACYFRCKADPARTGSWTGQDTRGWSELGFHMFHAGRKAELQELLMNYLWIRGRLRRTDVLSLISDYQLMEPQRNDPLGLVQGSLLLSANVLSQDNSQLPTELTARLLGFQHQSLDQFLRQIRKGERDLWLRPLFAGSLMAPGGALLRTLEGHGFGVWAVSVTPDGKQIVSASRDHTLKVWDLESGTHLRTLKGHASWVYAVAVTPDGRRVISGSMDNSLKVWDLESGSCLRTLVGHEWQVNAVGVTPDGRRVISGSDDNTLKVWDLESDTCLQTLVGHSDAVQAVSVTSDGRLVVSSTRDNTLKVWDLESGTCLHTLAGHGDSVEAVSVTSDGQQVVSASRDKSLKVWDLESGTCIQTLTGDNKEIRAVAVTPDGRRAISGSNDKVLKVWDLESGTCLSVLEGHSDTIRAVVVTPDGRRAISGSDDLTLKIWDLQAGNCLQVAPGHDEMVHALAVTPDGQRAISGSGDKTLKVWDLESGTCLQTLVGHSDFIRAAAMTPDGQRAISGSWDKTLKIWDLESGTCLQTLAGHSHSVEAVSVTPDGWKVVSASRDKSLKVWDLESGACLRTLVGHANEVWAVAITPDGSRAISGSVDKTLKFWDLESGTCLRTMAGHDDVIGAIAVMPDGRLAISGSHDETLKIWDLESSICVRTLEGHGYWVLAVAITPDGRRVVSGSRDKTLKVWDLESGRVIASFTSEAWIFSCAVGSDSVTIVAGDALGRVHFLRLEGSLNLKVPQN